MMKKKKLQTREQERQRRMVGMCHVPVRSY